MSENDTNAEKAIHQATQEIISRLLPFPSDTRRRIFRTTRTFFEWDEGPPSRIATAPDPLTPRSTPRSLRELEFTDRTELGPKEFLFEKQPQTDIDRIACLAYYLSHYRDTKHFRTIDLSKLNTEGAQIKFSNTAFAVVNATNAGLLVPAGKGNKQLSALGERYVEALPNREAAKEVLAGLRNRKARRNSKGAMGNSIAAI